MKVAGGPQPHPVPYSPTIEDVRVRSGTFTLLPEEHEYAIQAKCASGPWQSVRAGATESALAGAYHGVECDRDAVWVAHTNGAVTPRLVLRRTGDLDSRIG